MDFSAIVNSMLGSLVAGLLLLASAPLWYRRLFNGGVPKGLREWFPAIMILAVALALFALVAFLQDRQIPRYHGMTDSEARAVYSECEMKAIEATAAIRSSPSRDTAKARFKAQCLIRKGFRFEP